VSAHSAAKTSAQFFDQSDLNHDDKEISLSPGAENPHSDKETVSGDSETMRTAERTNTHTPHSEPSDSDIDSALHSQPHDEANSQSSNHVDLQDEIRQSEKRAREKEEHVSEVASKYQYERRPGSDDELTDENRLNLPEDERIKDVCRLEFGINDAVDAKIVCEKLGLPLETITSWLDCQINYKRLNRPGFVYTQRINLPKDLIKDNNKVEQTSPHTTAFFDPAKVWQ
jgi:hypothetical protein